MVSVIRVALNWRMPARPIRQIAAVLGHSTMKQVQTYRKQASQMLLARGGQALRDEMYERDLHNEAINLAANVTKIRA
jgi:hypothetical protein